VNKYIGWSTEQLLKALDELDQTMDRIEQPVAGERMEDWFHRIYQAQVDLVRLQTELARRNYG